MSGCGSIVDSMVKDAFALIVTGLYFCHTHATIACLKCLFKFVKNGFFDCDFVLREDSLLSSAQGLRLTLLEGAVEAITDQIDHADFDLLQFISSFLYVVLQQSHGRLPSSCLHRILCSMAAITMRRVAKSQQQQSETDYYYCCYLDNIVKDHEMALETRSLQMYFSCLEKLDEYCIRLQDGDSRGTKEEQHHTFAVAMKREKEDLPSNESMVHAIVGDLVGDVVENMELSYLMARTQEYINRQSSDYCSRAFWVDLITLARASSSQYVRGVSSSYVFASLCVLCKMASVELHSSSHTTKAELVPRDVAVKLCGIQFLNRALQVVCSGNNAPHLLGYEIRRLIPPIVLESTSSSLSNVQLFAALLNLVGTLLHRYRMHCKLELAVLIEKFVLQTLRGPSQYSIRLLILRELQLWVREPYILIELFVNYDMDRMWIVQRRKVFENIVSSVRVLAEAIPPLFKDGGSKKGMNVSAWFASTSPHSSDAIELHEEALQCAVYIMMQLMEASRSSIIQSIDRHHHDMAAGGIVNGSDNLELPSSASDRLIEQYLFGYSPMPPPPPNNNNSDLCENEARCCTTHVESQKMNNNSHNKFSETANGEENEDDGAVVQKTKRRPVFLNQQQACFYAKKEDLRQEEKIVKRALDLYQTEGLKKCVDFLIVSNYITDSPRDIATFLHVFHEELSPNCVGEFLSEPDEDGEDKWKRICLQYVKAISFHDMSLEKALRCFLTTCGFRLPGEALKR